MGTPLCRYWKETRFPPLCSPVAFIYYVGGSINEFLLAFWSTLSSGLRRCYYPKYRKLTYLLSMH